MRGATVAPSGQSHKSWDSKMSYLMTYNIHYPFKLGEIIVDIHTYKLCKIRDITFNFWVLHTLKSLNSVIAQKGQLTCICMGKL